jgi:hypothetical protein
MPSTRPAAEARRDHVCVNTDRSHPRTGNPEFVHQLDHLQCEYVLSLRAPVTSAHTRMDNTNTQVLTHDTHQVIARLQHDRNGLATQIGVGERQPQRQLRDIREKEHDIGIDNARLPSLTS